MFDSDLYQVKQKGLTLGKKYTVEESGRKILESREKEPDLKRGFVLYSDEDEPVLELTGDQHLDAPTSFTLLSRDKEIIGGFQRHWSFLSHDWHIIGPDNNIVGIVEQKNNFMGLMRRFVFEFLPFRFRMTSQEGEKLGRITGRFSVRDNYTVELKDGLDPRLAVAAAVLIDIEEKF